MLSSALNGKPPEDRTYPMNNSTPHVSTSYTLSTSPVASYSSPTSARVGSFLTRTGTGGPVKQLKPFATEDIKILLLENVNKTGQDVLEAQGYQVDFIKSSLPEDELIEKIRWGIQVYRHAGKAES